MGIESSNLLIWLSWTHLNLFKLLLLYLSIQYLAICIANELFMNCTSPFKPSSILFKFMSFISFIFGAKHNGIFNESALSFIIFKLFELFDSIVKARHDDFKMPDLCHDISSIVLPSLSQCSSCSDAIPHAIGFLFFVFNEK